MTLRVLSLFAGIGGFDLGLERTGGFKTVAFCEIDPFRQSKLSKHWPGVPIYGDVRALAASGYDAEWRNIPAWLVGLPTERQRVWIVAYPQQERWEGLLPHFLCQHEAARVGDHQAAVALAASCDLVERTRGRVRGESPFFDGAYGLPEIVGGLAAGGDAVVPQIPELIGRAILASLNEQRDAA